MNKEKNQMKVIDIRSFFGSSSSSSNKPTVTSPQVVQVPSRFTKKKKKKQESVVVEEEEEEDDDLVAPVKEVKKKRTARALSSSSDDDDDFQRKDVKKKKRGDGDDDGDKMKKQEVVVVKKKEKAVVPEKKPVRIISDPSEYFSREKIQRKRGEEKAVVVAVVESSSPGGRMRSSPRKQNVSVKEEQVVVSSPKKNSPKKEKVSSPEKKNLKKTPPKKKVDKKKKKVESDSDEEGDFNPKKQSSRKKQAKKEEEEPEESPYFSDTPTKSSSSRNKKSPKKKSTPARKKSPQKKPPKKEPDDDDDIKEAPKKSNPNYAKFLAHKEAKPRLLGQKPIPKGAPNCLEGLVFVVTGILESLERDTTLTLIERYGGKLRSAVSGKTNYLIVGDDPGESKLKKARDLRVKQISEDDLLGMIRESDPEGGEDLMEVEVGGIDQVDADKMEVEEEEPPKKKKTSINNNDVTPPKKQPPPLTPPPIAKSLMWPDKYAPQTLKQIVGQSRDTSNAHKLVNWLTNWFKNHSHSATEKKKPPFFANRDPTGSTFKCALLSGPPGIGKTTTAHLACKQVGYDYFELNASDTRNKRGLKEQVSDVLNNKTIFKSDLTSRHVLIMDEVDGMSGNEDRGGVQELIQLIKSSKVPVICICNDRNCQKIRSLSGYCYDLRFNKPTHQELKGFIASISFKEKLKIPPEQVTQLISSTDNDVRQILHQLELFKERPTDTASIGPGGDRTLNPKKDLRFGPWDVCRKVFWRPEKQSMTVNEKCGLFFQDYSFGPLFVQENYLKWGWPTKAGNNRFKRMSLISQSASSIADGDLCDTIIRKTNNWSLLPVQSIFSSYVPGELMEADTNGGVEFPAWLGKNSNRGKRQRMLQGLSMHMHLQVSGGGIEALQMDYMGYLRGILFGGLTQGDLRGVVGVMEAYSLIRDDVESINELTTWPGVTRKNSWEKIESKTKAAFTRMLNKEVAVLPYSNDMGVKKGGSRKGGGGQEGEELFGEDEEQGGGDSSEDDGDVTKDAMIKMKKKKGVTGKRKKRDQDEDDDESGDDSDAAGPSTKKKKKTATTKKNVSTKKK